MEKYHLEAGGQKNNKKNTKKKKIDDSVNCSVNTISDKYISTPFTSRQVLRNRMLHFFMFLQTTPLCYLPCYPASEKHRNNIQLKTSLS